MEYTSMPRSTIMWFAPVSNTAPFSTPRGVWR